MATLQGRRRAAYVQTMFDRIAKHYDLMNRIMTFGQDRRWRRYVIAQANVPPGGHLLDVAVGTGDIVFEALKGGNGIRAVGADFSHGMMRVGQVRPNGDRIRWVESDALHLPFPTNTFDAATSGYLARNVIDVEGMFREQMRVVKPGGRVICLDTSPPPKNLLRPFILLHLRVVIPALGRLIAGDSSAYTYLPESTESFKSPEELAVIMQKAGLINVRYKSFMFGTMAVHQGEKPGAAT